MNPQEYNGVLALSFHNITDDLLELGRLEDALKHCQDALSLWKELIALKPRKYNLALGKTLRELASILRDLGRDQELASSYESEGIQLIAVVEGPSGGQSDN